MHAEFGLTADHRHAQPAPRRAVRPGAAPRAGPDCRRCVADDVPRLRSGARRRSVRVKTFRASFRFFVTFVFVRSPPVSVMSPASRRSLPPAPSSRRLRGPRRPAPVRAVRPAAVTGAGTPCAASVSSDDAEILGVEPSREPGLVVALIIRSPCTSSTRLRGEAAEQRCRARRPGSTPALRASAKASPTAASVPPITS